MAEVGVAGAASEPAPVQRRGARAAEPREPAAGRARCLWLTKGLGRGGVERLLVDMYPLIDGDRFEIDVAYVLPWKDNYHRALTDAGASVTCLGSARSGDPRWVGRLRQLIRQRGYELIHTHAPVPAVAARAVSGRRGSGPALVHTEHNMWDRYRWPTRVMNSLTYHRNSAAIAVSDTVARTIDPLWSARRPPVTTVHHGTVLDSVRSWSPAERRRRRAELGLPAEGVVIGNVGNFTAKKDHASLLRAVAGLVGSGEDHTADVHLVLVGLGPLETDLREQTARLGIEQHVTFLGSRDDVFELLPLFDLFCLSSRFEGFPIALVEAMATGLACVATDVGGIGEILADGDNGLLVESGDAAALGRALARFITDPALAERCGNGARASAERLDLRHAVGELEAVYSETLGRRTGSAR